MVRHLLTGTVNTGTVNTGTVNTGTAGVSPAMSAQREQSGNSKLLGDATQAGETPAVPVLTVPAKTLAFTMGDAFNRITSGQSITNVSSRAILLIPSNNPLIVNRARARLLRRTL
jgi:hypothetical protein